MKDTRPDIGLRTLCGLFGLTRQSYYNYVNRSIEYMLLEEQVVKRILAVRNVHPRMGCRKIYALIKEDLGAAGLKVGRDKLFDIMSDNQLLIRKRKPRVGTTNSNHPYKRYKNLTKGFAPYQANQLWVSDITYIRSGGNFKYLFLITDAYSKKVVGYKLADTLETKHAIDSLKQALRSCANTPGLIHHSDRGIQYCSHRYVKLLQDYEVEISMTEDGDPRENAIAERINGILKSEYIEPLKTQSRMPLAEIISTAIHRYNSLRPHLSCDMHTPCQAHEMKGELRKRWKNYYNNNQPILV